MGTQLTHHHFVTQSNSKQVYSGKEGCCPAPAYKSSDYSPSKSGLTVDLRSYNGVPMNLGEATGRQADFPQRISTGVLLMLYVALSVNGLRRNC